MTHQEINTLMRVQLCRLIETAACARHDQKCPASGQLDKYGQEDALHPDCSCGLKKGIDEAVLLLARTSPRGKHCYSPADGGHTCVKCHHEMGFRYADHYCESEIGL